MTSAFDQPRQLLGQLGSVWTGKYADRSFALALATAQCQAARQNLQKLQNAADWLAWDNLPLYETQDVLQLTILQSEVIEAYGDYIVNAPDTLVDVACIADRITDPTITLESNIDFHVYEHQIYFNKDPFNTLAAEPVFSGGAISDYKLTLWLMSPLFDTSLLYRRLGYVLNINLGTSDAYRKLIRLIADAAACGTSRTHLEQILSVIYDIPLATYGDEIVTEITSDAHYKWVITTKGAYPHTLGTTITVVIGQELAKNQPMTDDYLWIYPNANLPAGIDYIPIPQSLLLGGSYTGGLQFPNTSVTPAFDGYGNASFDITGETADKNLFWSTFNYRAVQVGTTLEALFIAGGLDTSVNPAIFALQQILRHNGIVVRINTAAAGENAINSLVAVNSLMKRILPPRMQLILDLRS